MGGWEGGSSIKRLRCQTRRVPGKTFKTGLRVPCPNWRNICTTEQSHVLVALRLRGLSIEDGDFDLPPYCPVDVEQALKTTEEEFTDPTALLERERECHDSPGLKEEFCAL